MLCFATVCLLYIYNTYNFLKGMKYFRTSLKKNINQSNIVTFYLKICSICSEFSYLSSSHVIYNSLFFFHSCLLASCLQFYSYYKRH